MHPALQGVGLHPLAALEAPQLATLREAFTFGVADVREHGQHRQEAANVEDAGVDHGRRFPQVEMTSVSCSP
jgi:hypothetical protein